MKLVLTYRISECPAGFCPSPWSGLPALPVNFSPSPPVLALFWTPRPPCFLSPDAPLPCSLSLRHTCCRLSEFHMNAPPALPHLREGSHLPSPLSLDPTSRPAYPLDTPTTLPPPPPTLLCHAPSPSATSRTPPHVYGEIGPELWSCSIMPTRGLCTVRYARYLDISPMYRTHTTPQIFPYSHSHWSISNSNPSLSLADSSLNVRIPVKDKQPTSSSSLTTP